MEIQVMTEKNDTSRLNEKYIFRNIRQEEIAQAAEIEKICFPPNEACSYEHMEKRVEKAPELFLVAEDRATGRIAGFLNGLATDREHLTDDFFTDAEVHDPKGKNIMLLGLDVLPEYQHQGLARELVRCYKEREKANGREKLILTCLPDKVEMYQKFGFKDHGIGGSVWGGEAWHEMSVELRG
jgi:ribosomal protein S18 acetylase RimI-like enzyme